MSLGWIDFESIDRNRMIRTGDKGSNMTKFSQITRIISLYLLGVFFSFSCKSSSDKLDPILAIGLFLSTQVGASGIVQIDNTGTKEWTKLLGVTGQATLSSAIASDSSGNIYTSGNTAGNLDGQTKTGSQDMFVAKYDNNGNKQWVRLLGAASASSLGKGITVDSSGNAYISGYTTGNMDGQTKTGTNDLFVVKYDSSGNKQWTRLLGVTGVNTQALAITSDSSGNIYASGYTEGNLDGQTKTGASDLFVVKYDSNGNKQWTKLVGVTGGGALTRAITSDRSGNLYLTGETNGNLGGQTKTGSQDMFAIKLGGDGNVQWTQLLGGNASATTQGLGITRDLSNNVYITGITTNSLDGQTVTGGKDLFVVKYDTNGNKQWTKLTGITGGHFTEGFAITSDNYGNSYAAGSTTGNLDGQSGSGGKDLVVIKYDTNGSKQWTRLLGVSGSASIIYGIVSDIFGNLYATGETSGNLDGVTKTGGQDAFLIKYK
ncbi:SBBP repeat-containing protein [Leptospira idonii]|nr:SBBP repeat-containing protein [Leptospira idonii]